MSKRIVTIQDYSCLGRCSLTVALPIISSAGIECVGIPTALLSNHTKFPSFSFLDLGDELKKIVNELKEKNLESDYLYTGYLGLGQSNAILSLLSSLKGATLFVDPAFGDDGKLYKGFDERIVEQSLELIKKAKIIKPNLTEALFLLKKDPSKFDRLNENETISILKELSLLGPSKIVLTDCRFQKGFLSILTYDEGEIKIIKSRRLPGKYHGAGDCYASALISLITKGNTLFDSAKMAHEFVKRSIKQTIKEGKDGVKSGLEFEKELKLLSY